MFSTKNYIQILGLFFLLTLIVPSISSTTQTNANVTDVNITPEISTMSNTEDNTVQSVGEGPDKYMKDENLLNDGPQRMERPQSNFADVSSIIDPTPRNDAKDLPDSLATLVNGSSVTGDILQNEFIVYDFAVTDVNGSTVTIYCNFTNSVGDWMDVMIDDATGDTLEGGLGLGEDDFTVETNLDAGTYTLILYGADVTVLLDFELDLLIAEIIESPPDGSTFPGSLPVEFNTTYDFQLSVNATVYEWYGGGAFWHYVPSLALYEGGVYAGTLWATFEVPTNEKYDLNITATYDAGDIGMWYDTDASHDPFFYGTGTVTYSGISYTGSGVENFFLGGAGPAQYWVCLGAFEILSVDAPVNITLTVNQTVTDPFPIDQAFAIAVGDEVVYNNETLLAYNITLVANETYIFEIGEPDNWYIDYYGYDWGGNYENDLALYINDYNGTELTAFDDSMGEYSLWLTPWYARFTADYSGEYTIWFGPNDGVSPSIGTFQIIDGGWACENAPSLSTAEGSWYNNFTTDEMNIVDIYNIEVLPAEDNWLHIIEIIDDFGDDLHYVGCVLYDENLTLVKDTGFRTAMVYDEPYANPTVAEMLPTGNYTFVVQSWYPDITVEWNQSYTINHDSYDVASLDPEQTMTDQVVAAGGINYYVLDPVGSTRYGIWGIDVISNVTSDVTVTLFDADLQYAREIRNDGGEGDTETIVHVIDQGDTPRDGGKNKVIVVESNSTHDATFNITFYAASPPNLLTQGTQTGVLDAVTNPTNFHIINAVAGDYKFNYTSMWYNTTDETSLAWEDSPYPTTNNTWLRFWRLDATAVPVSYAELDYINQITLAEGVYFVWVTTGDWEVDPTNLYGRCGWSTNLNVSYTLELVDFLAPAAADLDIYANGMIDSEIDSSFSVDLEASQSYYFWWDDDNTFDFDATLYNNLGSAVVSGSAGWDPFIYTPLFPGTYTFWLHEYEWLAGSSVVSVRPLELVEEFTPDHIVSQWSFDFDLESDYWYVLNLVGDMYTSMGNGEGIIVDELTDPYTADLDFFAWVSGSGYGVGWAGMFTMELYRIPHIIETVTTTETETETETPDPVTVIETETTTEAGAAGATVTTTETESPGFELLVFLLAIPAFFLIRRRRS